MSSQEFNGKTLSGGNDCTKRFQLSAQRLTKHGLIQSRHPYDMGDAMAFNERR